MAAGAVLGVLFLWDGGYGNFHVRALLELYIAAVFVS
jgi:hypothetical protein